MLALLTCIAMSAVTSIADARPGGGGSYSSGSSRSSSSSSYRSSSGSGGSAPGSGAILVFGCVIYILILVISSRREPSATFSAAVAAGAWRPAGRERFRPLIHRDAAFSQTAFEDFAFQLYARAQRARGKPGELAALTPYLAQPVLERLAGSTRVDAVVIGSLRCTDVQVSDAEQRIDVRVEANLIGAHGTYNVIERWTFVRGPSVVTRTPEAIRTFPCPHCGAPFQAGAGPRTCAHCSTEMEPGRFDWTVSDFALGAVTSVGPTLTGTVPEVGTDLPTVVDHEAYAGCAAIYEADKNVTWDAFSARVSMIYHQLNTAWNAQDLTPVRGLVTSSLLQYLQFWVDEYKRQHLKNKLEDARISRLAIAKVQRDPTFDAITVRVFADGLDYTVYGDDKIAGGSKSVRRAYSEYWTLIRSAVRRGPVVTEPKCPNCGAPLSISDVGACTHCNALVENGAFDWVLSKIEQDEVYTG